MVLDWNKDAATAYDKWGGNSLPDWVTYRMTQDTILKHVSTDDDDSTDT